MRSRYAMAGGLLLAGLVGAAIFIPRVLNRGPQPAKFVPITSENAASLTLGFALPGECGGFSPDDTLLATNRYGVYTLATGQQRFAISGNGTGVYFNRDGSLLLASDDGVYRVESGERLYTLDGFANFSSGGRFVLTNNSGGQTVAMDAVTGEARFGPWFFGVTLSADDSLVIDRTQGQIYRVDNGEMVFQLPDNFSSGVFSPDGSLLGIRHSAWEPNGIYQLASGERRLAISGNYFFSPDGRTLAVQLDGETGFHIYDIDSGNELFSVPVGYTAEFSPDSSAIATADALYDIATGESRFATTEPVFSSDAVFLVDREGLRDAKSGVIFRGPFAGIGDHFSKTGLFVVAQNESKECLIYGPDENIWPYRSGLVDTRIPVVLYTSPNGQQLAVSEWRYTAVVARTADNSWFKVMLVPEGFTHAWIRASDVEQIISMPDAVPVENP